MKNKKKTKKVFLFGIDGAPPEFILDKWKSDLPNISKLMDNGIYAKVNSTIPPSTIIAWSSMISGKDASEIGIFSYTCKDKNNEMRLVNSRDVKCRMVWDILDKYRKKTIALYVPLTYPVKKINGVMVSGFLTPGVEGDCCYPNEIKEKIKAMKNQEFFFDVSVGLAGHKGLDIKPLLEKTYKMTDMQIKLIKDLIVNQEWDFFISIAIGTDRLQHMLWRHFDKTHRRYIKDSPYESSLKDYYIYLDKKLGEIIELVDDACIIIASDHGMVKQEGKININNWLIKEGYLVLKEGIDLSKKRRFEAKFVNMKKSLAYSGGAYNARIYINKELAGNNYKKIQEELIKKLKNLPDDRGGKINTIIYKSEDIYKNPSNEGCPDLTVYFDNLRWASNPDLGQEGLYSWETAVGADSAGHSRQGCFIISGKGIKSNGKIDDIDIRQIAPTILRLLDVELPKDIEVEAIGVT